VSIKAALSTATFYSMNPEPIAPAAPILVHSLDEEEDGYAQQEEVEDCINIDIRTTKHKSGTGLRVEKPTCSTVKYLHRSEKGNDHITIDFRTDIRPPHQPQREPELGLGEATVRPPAISPQQDSLHIIRLYYHTCTRNLLQCQCGRFEGLVLGPIVPISVMRLSAS